MLDDGTLVQVMIHDASAVIDPYLQIGMVMDYDIATGCYIVVLDVPYNDTIGPKGFLWLLKGCELSRVERS